MKLRLKMYWKAAAAGLLCACVLFASAPAPTLAESSIADEATTSLAEEAPGNDVQQEAGDGEDAVRERSEAEKDSMFTPQFDVQAEAAYLVNEDSGVVVYQKNAQTPIVAASLVKMMTCILVMEHIEDLDGTTVTMENWVNEWLYGKNPSVADIRTGETVSYRELLYAMLLPSGNEAALMAAGDISGGDISAFVQLMNNKAAEIGCISTRFADPNGLSEDNLTTARDMYYITREFAKYPLLREICQADTYEMAQHEQHSGAYNIFTTNRMIVSTSPYYTEFPTVSGTIKAAKTGSLGDWQNFACMAELNGITYYSVVLHSPDEADAIAVENEIAAKRPALYETGRILDWAFMTFSIRAALNISEPATSIRVLYSTEADVVNLMPADNITTILPHGADDSTIQRSYSLPEEIEAPVKQGDVIGTVTLSLGGQQIGTTQLIAAKDVERNNTLYTVEQVKGFTQTGWFKLILVAVVVLVVGYIVFAVFFNGRKRKKRDSFSPKRR